MTRAGEVTGLTVETGVADVILVVSDGAIVESGAHEVEPFFWSDAEMIHVRLCEDCAAHLHIDEAATRLTNDDKKAKAF